MELLKDIFIVKEMDMIPIKNNDLSNKIKNKIFSKVSRIFAISKGNKIEITLDVNTDIYEINDGDKLDLIISKITPKENTPLTLTKNWHNFFDKNLIDVYEYVMYGTIFHSGFEGKKFFVYGSFGGLLMKIFGDLKATSIEELKIDSKILILIRKI
jgi:DNA-directed RNA polymerase I, II, and III subunit RPABC3